MTYQRMFRWAVCTAVFAGSFAALAANMTPVTVSGFNRDVVIENTVSGPPYTAALNFNAGENTCFYQTNLAGKTFGLPATGTFANTNDSTTYQLQSYITNNALVLSADTGMTNGTLKLALPRVYDRLGVIANSGNGNATGLGALTVRFNDGTTYETNYYAPDWFNNSNSALYTIALQGVERINLTSGAVSGAPSNPRFYQTTIILTNVPGILNKRVSSLTFGKASGNSTGIYAVSGETNTAQTNLIFSLATVTNLPATAITTTSATLTGQVLSSGNDAPLITIYYGPTNGGTNAAAWSNNIVVGWRTGMITQSVAGLSVSATYYFAAKAENAAGISWAMPAGSFATATPQLPAITNLSPGNVLADHAALQGRVISTGGDTPNVTIFYGTTDGGTNAAAWSNSIAVGLQSGFFARAAFGLSPSTVYYCNVRAMNLAGTSWGTSIQFTTLATNPPPAPVAVLAHHNDDARTGANLNETILHVGNVNTNTFGLLYTRAVDDQVYAQPLIATNVNIPGIGLRNVLYVCTVSNTVYAFDADDPLVVAPYWKTNFNTATAVPPRNTDMTGACGGNYRDFSGNMGIVGTPVIDSVAGTIYFVVRTKENGSTYVQRLHALDIRTGGARANSPIVINGSVPGTGSGSVGGVVSFDPQRNNQRAGLVLVSGIVYVTWSSHCDWGPYHGWVLGYNSTNLQREVVYCATANGNNAGIWMSGQAPAVDASGDLYISTGNGSVGTAANRSDSVNRGESFLKLTRSGTNLVVSSFFTPFNWQALENGDIDLGSAGMLLIPGTTLAFSGGKEGKVYLVNRDNMGGLSGSSTADTNVIQSFQVTSATGQNDLHGGPVWWDGPDGSYAYIQGESDFVRQYRFDRGAGLFELPNFARNSVPAWVGGMPGGIMSLSASGTNAGSGILWVSHQYSGDANQAVRPGILRAYDAQNISVELWNSQQFVARDAVGQFGKYVPPTVAKGKVYLATFSNRLNVYGLLPPGPPRIHQHPQHAARYSGDSFALAVAASSGTTPLTYQWWKGAAPIVGETNASLAFDSLEFADADTYSVRITNAQGFAISSNAAVVTVQAPTISYAQTVLADNPIAYWRLNETNGSIVRDSVGGHDGQYFNVKLGMFGYNTNDTDTAIEVGTLSATDSHVGGIEGIDFSTFTNNVRFSVEAWVNAGIQTTDAGIVTHGYGSGGEQFNLDTGNGGRFRFAVRNANNTAFNAGGTVYPSNTWQHLVGVCDLPNNNLRLYVNGVQVGSNTISGGIQLGTSPISIGSRESGFSTTYNFNFVGRIDEVAIYNHALSATQVLNHYAAGTNPVVFVYIEPAPGNVVLTWSPGTLQSATNVTGPYADIPAAVSPYTLPASIQQRYFRVRVR